MPCYDKKLEASRPDFYDDVHATRDVDCVITTGELDRMMRERGWDLSRPATVNVSVPAKREEGPSRHRPDTNEARLEEEGEGEEDQTRDEARFVSDEAEPESGNGLGRLGAPELPSLLTHPGTSSGSYLHSLLGSYTSSAESSLVLTSRTLRSADYEEYTLTDSRTGRVVFRGARCYGFRNLQNLVRRVGRDAGVQVGRGAAGRLAGGRAKGAAARVVRARKMKGDPAVTGAGAGTEAQAAAKQVDEERG